MRYTALLASLACLLFLVVPDVTRASPSDDRPELMFEARRPMYDADLERLMRAATELEQYPDSISLIARVKNNSMGLGAHAQALHAIEMQVRIEGDAKKPRVVAYNAGIAGLADYNVLLGRYARAASLYEHSVKRLRSIPGAYRYYRALVYCLHELGRDGEIDEYAHHAEIMEAREMRDVRSGRLLQRYGGYVRSPAYVDTSRFEPFAPEPPSIIRDEPDALRDWREKLMRERS